MQLYPPLTNRLIADTHLEMTWDSAKPRDLSLVSGVKCPFELECGVSLPALSGGKGGLLNLGEGIAVEDREGQKGRGTKSV